MYIYICIYIYVYIYIYIYMYVLAWCLEAPQTVFDAGACVQRDEVTAHRAERDSLKVER